MIFHTHIRKVQDLYIMDSSTPTQRPRSPVPISRFLKTGIDPSIGPVRFTTTREMGKHRRTIFQSVRDKKLADARELYRQVQLGEHEKLSEQFVPGSEHSTAMDIKECVLQVQKVCLRDLAVEENHLKGFTRIPGAITIDLEKSYKEVERVINALHLRERKV